MATAIVAALGDTHCNSFFGLCPPYFEHPGGTHKANKAQRILWGHWLRFVDRLEEVKRTHDAPLITVLNGDICDNDIRSTQFIVQSDMQMLRLTVSALEPILAVSDRLFVTEGTPSHTRSIEDKIGEDIGAENDGQAFARWQWHLQVAGVEMWFGHHGSMGRLPHTQRNAANKLAAETIMKCAMRRVSVPDVVVRSHQHRWADSYDNFILRGMYLPGWQLPTPYIYRLDPDAIPEIGGAIFVCRDGEYTVEKYQAKYTSERPVKVVV